MKAIERCCECSYYNMEKHGCERGAKDKGEPTARFYADCPLDEAEIVRHAQWKKCGADKRGRGGVWMCTGCKGSYPYKSRYCPNCGAKMDGGDDDD